MPRLFMSPAIMPVKTTLEHCERCHRPFTDFATDLGTGYGTTLTGEHICYACCADADRVMMREDGKIDLYLTDGNREVTNWPGTLRYTVSAVRRSRHVAFGGDTERLDIWFRDDSGREWHGVHRGHNNTIVRCRRLAA